MAALVKAPCLVTAVSLVCVSARTTMMAASATNAVWVTTTTPGASSARATLADQCTSSVRPLQGSVRAKEASVASTVISAAVDIMDSLIVELVSAILLGLNLFQTGPWVTVHYPMRCVCMDFNQLLKVS